MQIRSINDSFFNRNCLLSLVILIISFTSLIITTVTDIRASSYLSLLIMINNYLIKVGVF